MRRTQARIYWLAPGLVAAACGGATDELFGPGASGASGSGGSQVASGGTVGNGGAPGEGGAPVSGGAGQAPTGGTAGTGNTSGGSSGNAAGGGTAGKGGAAGSAGKGGAGGSAGAAGKGGAGGSAGAVATGGVTSAGAGGQGTCDAMRAELPKLLTAAQVCDISLGRSPCAGFVSNECGCKVPVDAPSLAPAQSYVTAVAAVTKCGIVCPAIGCVEPVAAHCQTEGALAKGHCVVGAAP